MINKALGMVPNASDHGLLVDWMLELCHWFMAILFIGWSCYFFYALWRFNKKRNPKADYHGVQSKASAHLEFSVVVIEAILLLGFALPLWANKRVDVKALSESPDAIKVHAVGEQFLWSFHYSGPDGKFGRQSASLVSASNPLGIDWSDPDAQDDIVKTNELHLVNKRPVVVEVTSKDVIHNLSMKHMRMEQDAIPGTKIPLSFRPVRNGVYQMICGQLCGNGHYSMKSEMTVESQTEFDAWYKENLDLRKGASAPAPAANAAPAPAAAPAAK